MAYTRTYYLKHFDTPLMLFSASTRTANPNIEIIETYDDNSSLMPYDLSPTVENLNKWIKHRTIPHNRAYVAAFLAKCGLSLNRPMDIISVSKGLSLTDCYWICEEDFDGTFDEVNLYDNPFNTALAYTAFSGFGNSHSFNAVSSPEFTTNGMLRKCWRRNTDGVTRLYKGGTEGASNTGFEPYSEYYASKIAKVMGINVIDYDVVSWKKHICSTCEMFTSKDLSFVPIGNLVKNGFVETVCDFYGSLGQEYVEALNDMFLFDAVIYNTDRHLGNFGVLVDSHTNKIVAPAPIFDNGNSLFNMAGLDAFENPKSLSPIKEYANNLVPAVYDDFVEMAKQTLDDRRRGMLRKVLDMELGTYKPRYKLPRRRVKIIEAMVKERVREILAE